MDTDGNTYAIEQELAAQEVADLYIHVREVIE